MRLPFSGGAFSKIGKRSQWTRAQMISGSKRTRWFRSSCSRSIHRVDTSGDSQDAIHPGKSNVRRDHRLSYRAFNVVLELRTIVDVCSIPIPGNDWATRTGDSGICGANAKPMPLSKLQSPVTETSSTDLPKRRKRASDYSNRLSKSWTWRAAGTTC
jgi:hypothetical protein